MKLVKESCGIAAYRARVEYNIAAGDTRKAVALGVSSLLNRVGLILEPKVTMMSRSIRAKILKLEQVQNRAALPSGWTEAIGLLKGKKRVNPVRYQRQIRKDWEARLKNAALRGGTGYVKTKSDSSVESLAICSHCGKETIVPFKPTQGRQVYCRECQSRRSASSNNRPV